MSIPFVLQNYVQKGLSHNLLLWPAFGSRDDEVEKRRSKAGNIKGRAGGARAGHAATLSPRHSRGVVGLGNAGLGFQRQP